MLNIPAICPYSVAIRETISGDKIPPNLVGIQDILVSANIRIPTLASVLTLGLFCTERSLKMNRQTVQVSIIPLGKPEQPINMSITLDPNVSFRAGWALMGIEMGKPEIKIEGHDFSDPMEELIAQNFQHSLEPALLKMIESKIQEQSSDFLSHIIPCMGVRPRN